ncbi:unnamed protein product [Orchesella dallaii]|uniref:C2H2-type domain-containing protein n=1 Tax=Orchesella dallaii TaxID=48710 RepID=A0ABP1QKB9_9HEXA
MGLVEISEKMTSSVTIPTTGSRNPPASASINTSPGSATPDQVVRKKRTFDIAFLTGQSEKETSSTNSTATDFSNRESPSRSGTTNSNNNNNIERKCAAFLSSDRSHSPYNLTQDGTNSDSSSIDVMTNGSLSESESQSHSPSSSIPEQPSPPLHPVVLIHHQHQQQQLQQLKSIAPLSSNGGISHRNSNNSGHGHHHHHHHHHHVDIKSNSGTPVAGSGSSGHKSRNNRSPVKEEIRFESRRTIDINHTVDSLKIKENLQFSTLLPSSAAVSFSLSGNNGGGAGNGLASGSSTSGSSSRTISVTSGTDLTLPHLASTIALLPHVARFPLGLPSLAASGSVGGLHGNHMPPGSMPFHAKLEKSESINISYPKVRGGFPDPYAALAASAAGGYPYPNLLLSQEFSRHPAFPSPLGSPVNGSGASSAAGGGSGQQVNQAPPPPQVPQCGMSPSTTLLPPSLTSLTLPAQNVCAKCNIGFRMTSDLVYHMRSHHRRDTDPMKKQREEKLKCPVCHETFRERHHLTRHMTAHQDRAEEI